MKKVLLVLLVVMLATSFVSADEAVLYGASGEGVSMFAGTDDDGDVVIYYFGSMQDGMYRKGLITFQEDFSSEAYLEVEMKYYVHRNNINFQPLVATRYDKEGNEISSESGFDSFVGTFRIIRQDGETYLRLDGDLYILLN